MGLVRMILADGVPEIWNSREDTWRKGNVKERRYLGGTVSFSLSPLSKPLEKRPRDKASDRKPAFQEEQV